MVLESLADPLGAERKPYRMFFYGLLYTSVAIILSMWIFQSNASLVMVFLTTLACVPLMYNTMKLEEQKDESIISESALLKEHTRALMFFIFLFFGMVVAYTLWFVFLPGDVSAGLFSVQTETISNINMPTSAATSFNVQISSFTKILLNNVKVLIFCLLFAFLYGVGAIFILTWNASVIGAAMGSLIRMNISSITAGAGFGGIASYFGSYIHGIFRYALHGIPEILAYFVAGLATGIISVAVMRKKLDFEKLRHILLDSSDLVMISFCLLLLAAFIEVYVTAAIF